MAALSTSVNAQSDITGEYYLKGVMETASGFKLNPDSTFQFFFSSGALDRTGQGKWQRQGDKVIFNSRPYPGHDFRLLKSSRQPGDSITIKISDKNELLTHYVYAGMKTGNHSPELLKATKGVIRFPRHAFDTIILAFEFCPERTTILPVTAKDHNYFEFAFEDWLMEVFFMNFSLSVDKKGLTGGHPMMTRGNFVYEKE